MSSQKIIFLPLFKSLYCVDCFQYDFICIVKNRDKRQDSAGAFFLNSFYAIETTLNSS